MPKTEAPILQDIEPSRLKKNYTSSTKKPQESFTGLNAVSLKPNSLECMMLKMKGESLPARKPTIEVENMDLFREKCDSPEVADISFKILSSRNVKLAPDVKLDDNATEVVLSPKKKVKTKMSRLSLKKMLNNGPDTRQSNLNSFLDLKSVKIASNKAPIKSVKNKKSSRNLTENNDEEVRKEVYKISTAIFGTSKSKSKARENSEQPKKRNRKNKASIEIPKENIIKKVRDKIDLTDKFNDQLDEKLQEGLEMEIEHCEVDNQMVSQGIEETPDSPEPKSPKFSIDLTSGNNLELEVISDERKCKSLKLTPQKSRFSNDVKLSSPDKNCKLSSNKGVSSFSEKTSPGAGESPKKSTANALQFMMDMRNKVIGRNSPGKEKIVEDLGEDADLTQRKCMLQQWADKKGNTGKRKLVEAERGEYVELVLEKRAKRLKKLLKCENSEDVDVQIGAEDVSDNKKPEMERRSSIYMEEMSKSINCSKKDVDLSKIKDNDEVSLSNKIIVNKKRQKNKVATLDANFSPSKESTGGNAPKTSFNNTPILIDEDTSDQLAISKNAFSIFGAAKSSPKFQRKPLQQTLLFCLSNMEHKNSIKQECENNEDVVEIVKTPPLKIKVKKRGKLSLKGVNDNKESEENEKDKKREKLSLKVVNDNKESEDFETGKKRGKLSLKVVNDNKESEDIEKDKKSLVSKYLGMEVSEDCGIQEDVLKKVNKTRRNRIIDSDESSRDSVRSKASLLDNDESSKIENDHILLNQPSKKSKSSRKRAKVKLELTQTTISEHLSNLKNESVDNTEDCSSTLQENLSSTSINDSANLRRSCRVRKLVQHYEEIPENEVETVKTKLKAQKDAKIAAVFLKAVPKPKVDPAILEARRIFLHSASPMKMKETASLIENCEFEPFPTFSHVQQKTDSVFWNLPLIQPQKSTDNFPPNLNYDELRLNSFTNCHYSNISAIKLRKLTEIQNKKSILLDIKSRNPDYPVYKSYKLLKRKNKHARITLPRPDLNKTVPRKLLDDSCLIIDSENDNSFVQTDLVESSTLWTDKYKPTCSEDIIGNRSAAVDLLKFLKDRLESSNRKKANKLSGNQREDSDDDFESSDDDNTNSRDVRLAGNTMLLRGPHGSGKTCSIYAVCQELDINVLELNASSKRTGRSLLQKLQEATQSQQIHKQKDSQNLDKSLSKMCLLLVEDIDVVFEQDEGFITALTQLLQTTKRPIVLTFTDETNINVQRFIQQYPVVTFMQISANTCSVWLQLICLLENLLIDDGSLGELLEWNKGDLRKTLLQLQFWGLTGGDCLTKKVDSRENRMEIYKRLNEDESIDVIDDYSNTSEVNESLLEIEEFQHQQAISCFLSNSSHRLSLGQIWWNFETILQSPDIKETSKKNVLKSIQVFYESLSISDCLANKFGLTNFDLEPTSATFESKLKDSLSLDNFDDCFTTERDISKSMTDFLVDSSFSQIIDEGYRFNMGVPVATDRRWRCKQYDCQETFLAKLPLPLTFEHKSFALDYFPTLISIVKMEQTRLKINAKRRNRFYSYLRNLDIKLNDSQIKTLNCAFSSTS